MENFKFFLLVFTNLPSGTVKTGRNKMLELINVLLTLIKSPQPLVKMLQLEHFRAEIFHRLYRYLEQQQDH